MGSELEGHYLRGMWQERGSRDRMVQEKLFVSGAEKAIKEHKFQDEKSINYANYCRCQEGRD